MVSKSPGKYVDVFEKEPIFNQTANPSFVLTFYSKATNSTELYLLGWLDSRHWLAIHNLQLAILVQKLTLISCRRQKKRRGVINRNFFIALSLIIFFNKLLLQFLDLWLVLPSGFIQSLAQRTEKNRMSFGMKSLTSDGHQNQMSLLDTGAMISIFPIHLFKRGWAQMHQKRQIIDGFNLELYGNWRSNSNLFSEPFFRHAAALYTAVFRAKCTFLGSFPVCFETMGDAFLET